MTSRFHVSPSDSATASSAAIGVVSHDTSTASPTEGIQEIRKRMRSRQHKYAVLSNESRASSITGSIQSRERVDSSLLSDFAQSMRMDGTCSADEGEQEKSGAQRIDNDTRNLCESPPEPKRRAIQLTPPPTPGRNHAAARARLYQVPFPRFLPRSTVSSDGPGSFDDELAAPDLDHGMSAASSGRKGGGTKVPSSLIESYPATETSFQLRPGFASEWLQNILADKRELGEQHEHQEQAEEKDGVNADADDVVIPELPFQFVVSSRQRPNQHHGDNDGSPKVSADMAVAPLPPARGKFERANAA
mmetsp:Transcript_1355/g.2820  ORF Transcript_1355/g.2820 Transcript_1355/m.2820 type:complete len:304 (-) Transcript_1355:59-970(-)